MADDRSKIFRNLHELEHNHFIYILHMNVCMYMHKPQQMAADLLLWMLFYLSLFFCFCLQKIHLFYYSFFDYFEHVVFALFIMEGCSWLLLVLCMLHQRLPNSAEIEENVTDTFLQHACA